MFNCVGSYALFFIRICTSVCTEASVYTTKLLYVLICMFNDLRIEDYADINMASNFFSVFSISM